MLFRSGLVGVCLCSPVRARDDWGLLSAVRPSDSSPPPSRKTNHKHLIFLCVIESIQKMTCDVGDGRQR